MANLRFQLDEYLNRAVAQALRRAGCDAVTTAEAGLLGASDSAQLTHAHSAGFVIVTQDDDFLKLHAAGVAHSGIAYSPRASRSIGELVEMLLLLSATYDADGMVGRVEFI